jgi:hypothetical protein
VYVIAAHPSFGFPTVAPNRSLPHPTLGLLLI